MPSLESRITELESKTMGKFDGPSFFLHFVGVGAEPTPIKRIARSFADGLEWLALPGETDEAFRARVEREDETPAPPNCLRIYFCY